MLAGVAALFLVETLAFLALFGLALKATLEGMLVDIAVLGAIVVAVAAIVWLFPDRRRSNTAAAVLVVLVFGLTHWLVTMVGALAAVSYSLAHIPPPLGLAVTQPELALSLLSSVGISPAQAILFLLVTVALHLLLYVPIATPIVAGMRRVGTLRLDGPGQRTAAPGELATLYLALTALFCVTIPKVQMNHEPLHRGFQDSFVMAPAALMLANAAGADREALPAGPLAHPRPVVLIIVDALRRDRMGVYDPKLGTTPFLSSLLQSGALKRIDRTYGSCAFSFCGIMGILSSRTWDDFGSMPATMIDVFSRHGYRNYLVLSGNHSGFGNLKRLYGAGVTQLSDQGMNAPGPPNSDLDALQRLEATQFPSPSTSFVYLHLMSAHAGSYLLPQYRPAGPTSDPGAMENLYPGPQFGRRYDLGVQQADEMIRRIFHILEVKGLLPDAIVAITADHGERLGEDGLYLHGGAADERILSVPILIYDHGSAAYPSRPVASQIDIAPTFLQAIGAPIPRGMTGVPLQLATPRDAVPFGTSDTTGAIVRVGQDSYQFSCDRETGQESVRKLDQPQLDGVPVKKNKATRALYDHLRSAFRTLRRAGPVDLAPC